MNDINLTVELSKEDRKRLDEVVGLLALIAGELKSRPVAPETAAEPQDSPKHEAVNNDHPVDAVPPHGEPEPAAAPAAPKYTQADILAIVQRLIAPGSTKRAEAKAIVNDYAVKISAIPEDKYAEVMDRLIALEKEGV